MRLIHAFSSLKHHTKQTCNLDSFFIFFKKKTPLTIVNTDWCKQLMLNDRGSRRYQLEYWDKTKRITRYVYCTGSGLVLLERASRAPPPTALRAERRDRATQKESFFPTQTTWEAAGVVGEQMTRPCLSVKNMSSAEDTPHPRQRALWDLVSNRESPEVVLPVWVDWQYRNRRHVRVWFTEVQDVALLCTLYSGVNGKRGRWWHVGYNKFCTFVNCTFIRQRSNKPFTLLFI